MSKYMRFFLFACLYAYFGLDGARAQSTKVSPDCVLPFSVTVAQAAGAGIRVPSAGFPNKIPNISLPCTTWAVNYQGPTTVTGISVELDSAPDTAGVAGTWGAFSGTVVFNASNPTTALPYDFVIRSGSPAWVSAHLGSATGTGTITGALYGWVVPPSGFSTTTFTPTGTQDVNVTQVGGAAVLDSSLPTFSGCSLQAEVPLSGTGYTEIVAASGSLVIHVCNLAWSSASGGNPVVNTVTLGFGVCASAVTEALNMAGITGYTDVFGGSLHGAAGAALCVKESVANSDKVTVTYAQF